MRVLFAGTPVFAQAALNAIVAAGHQVLLVLTRADQPVGRGQRIQFSPVKQTAIEHSIKLLQPQTLRDSAVVQVLADQKADVMIVAAYGRILPLEVLCLPRYGCINIHASLLPRWRGAAPIQRAIEAGDTQTGITIMQMDEGLDTGDMLMSQSLAIGQQDNAGLVHDRLMSLGAVGIVTALERLERGALAPQKQPEQGVTYAKKIEKSEAPINWQLPAQQLHDKIRAFDPFPGCTTQRSAASQEVLKIWRTRVEAADPVTHSKGSGSSSLSHTGGLPTQPGVLVAVDEAQITVQCGENSRLLLLELQRSGGKRMPVGEFLKGFELSIGDRFTD